MVEERERSVVYDTYSPQGGSYLGLASEAQLEADGFYRIASPPDPVLGPSYPRFFRASGCIDALQTGTRGWSRCTATT